MIFIGVVLQSTILVQDRPKIRTIWLREQLLEVENAQRIIPGKLKQATNLN